MMNAATPAHAEPATKSRRDRWKWDIAEGRSRDGLLVSIRTKARFGHISNNRVNHLDESDRRRSRRQGDRRWQSDIDARFDRRALARDANRFVSGLAVGRR